MRRLDPDRFSGEISGLEVGLYTLRSPQIEASWCNHGARLLQLIVPDREGRLRDVVLGHDSLAQVQAGMASMGAFIGRFANRIAQARYACEGQTHALPANDGPHCLHGGPQGSRHQVFEVLASDSQGLSLGWTFADDGFPGQVALQVHHRLEGATLMLDYSAEVSGAATPLNFTSHPFFNLDGDASPSALGHELQIDAEHFVPVGPDRIPLGHYEPVAGTAFDFRRPRRVGQALTQGHAQLGLGPVPGYDHAFVTAPAGGLQRQARLRSPASGIVMEVWSDAPGLQLFSSAAMDGSLPRHAGKHGRVHGRGAGLCLEPQHLPDAPNQPLWGPCIYQPGQILRGQIQYRFSVDDSSNSSL
ncbi:MAG: aldose epimerase family protein [Betaproteobacteria bacterium]